MHQKQANKKKWHVYSYNKKQQCSQRDVPNKPDTRQHLNNTTSLDRRLPQSFTQNPKEKKVATSLNSSSSLALSTSTPSLPPAWSLARGLLVPAGPCPSWTLRLTRTRPHSSVANVHLRRTENRGINSGGTPTATLTGRSTREDLRKRNSPRETLVNSRASRSPGQNSTGRKNQLSQRHSRGTSNCTRR